MRPVQRLASGGYSRSSHLAGDLHHPAVATISATFTVATFNEFVSACAR